MRQIVCRENPFAGYFVPDHLGDVSPPISASRAIDLHHFERGPDPSRTETRNDPVLPVAKIHNLIFGPESGRWHDDGRRFAQQGRQRAAEFFQRSSLGWLVHLPPGQHHASL